MALSAGSGCDCVPEYESYGIVLQCILRDTALTVEAKAIYAYLCTFAGADGICYPSVSLMCKELGVSETRFYKHMKQLTTRGIVIVKKNRNGSQFAKNVYQISRASVSPSCRFEGTEIQAPVLPDCRITGAENGGINNTSGNITRVFNNTSVNSFVEQICNLLNEGKRKASSKGRIKVASGEWMLDELIESGISREEITAAAIDIAKNGIDHDWFSFARLFKKKR